MSFMLGISDKYDTSALIPLKRANLFQRVFIRLTAPFYLGNILMKILSARFSKNPLHDGKRQLSGNKLVTSTKDFELSEVK